jgi:hypothetical protein
MDKMRAQIRARFMLFPKCPRCFANVSLRQGTLTAVTIEHHEIVNVTVDVSDGASHWRIGRIVMLESLLILENEGRLNPMSFGISLDRFSRLASMLTGMLRLGNGFHESSPKFRNR